MSASRSGGSATRTRSPGAGQSQSISRRSKKLGAADSEKEDEPIATTPPTNTKTLEQELEEKLAATGIDVSGSVAPQPLHSPNDVLWTMSMDEILQFCFPAGVQHPLSRGRLWALASQGPLQRRHTYTACLCAKCKAALQARRKSANGDGAEYETRVYAGEMFTAANVPPRRSTANAAAAAPSIQEEEKEEMSGTLKAESQSTASNPQHTTETSSVNSLPLTHLERTQPLPTVANPSSCTAPAAPSTDPSQHSRSPSATSSSATANTMSSTLASTLRASSSSMLSSTPSIPSRPTIHNASPSPVSLPPAYASHTVDQLPFLCATCRIHVRGRGSSGLGECHLVAGRPNHRIVLTDLHLNELCRRLDETDLLQAYHRNPTQLDESEIREFLSKLDPDKVARARVNYTRQQVIQLLASVPRMLDEHGDKTDRMDFYAIQKAVYDEHERRIERLSKMYPDLTTKGDKSIQATALTLQHDAGKFKKSKKADQEAQAAATSNPTVNGVGWEGESILTTSLLARKFPPHQSSQLRTRLLHKYSHAVAELSDANHPSVQLSVAIMRNQHKSDRVEGWKTHF